MKDDTGRPGSGDKSVPQGTRARNRTMILGAERIGSIVGGIERATPAQPVAASEEHHQLDPLGLEAFEQDEFQTPTNSHDDFQSLDEIFGAVRGVPEEGASHQPAPSSFEPSPKDASSTLMGDLGLDDDFQSALDVFEPPAQTPLPVSAPKIVRSTSGNLAPQPQIMATDVFDPFAAIESEQQEASTAVVEQSVHQADDFESAFGEIAEVPSFLDEVAEESSTPKAEHSVEVGAANERLIVPPSLSATTISVVAAMGTEGVVPHQHTTSYHVSMEADYMNEPRDQIYWKNESLLVGFLVTYDHDPKGSYVELRQGRLMVSNQREESGSCLVVIGESVSPMHAIMRVAPGGHVQVLDQLSESGTRVRHAGHSEEEFLSGEKSSLSHGDIVFFGDRKFHVLLVVGESEG